jgi:hypothetical protein
LLWLFWRWGFSSLDWPWTESLPISASQVTGIISLSHQHGTYLFILR